MTWTFKRLWSAALCLILTLTTFAVHGCEDVREKPQVSAAEHSVDSTATYPVPKETKGLVNNRVTAKLIAEAVWLQAYGNVVLKRKPYEVRLIDSTTWYVSGHLDRREIGGNPHIVIRAIDGQIMDCYFDM